MQTCTRLMGRIFKKPQHSLLSVQYFEFALFLGA